MNPKVNDTNGQKGSKIDTQTVRKGQRNVNWGECIAKMSSSCETGYEGRERQTLKRKTEGKKDMRQREAQINEFENKLKKNAIAKSLKKM